MLPLPPAQLTRARILSSAPPSPADPTPPDTPCARARPGRWATLVAVLALALTATVLTGPAPASAATSSREARMVAEVNASRAAHGLPTLRPMPGMMAYARRHAHAMAARGVLYHTSNFAVICCWSRVAENIGYGFSVTGLHRSFLNSPGHRANLLDPVMRQVGIGIIESGGRLWITEVFRRPM
jgi:uncharacterized protein YkwD